MRRSLGATVLRYAIETWVGQRAPVAYEGDGGFRRAARLFHPSGVAFDTDGNLFLADSNNDAVRRVDLDGIITTVAGGNGQGFAGDGGPATAARLDRPTDIALTADGCLYIADRDNHRIRLVDRSGIITTLAGGNGQGFAGDGGPAADAMLQHPRAVALGADGSLYFTDRHNDAVRRIDPGGVITTVAGGNGQGFGGDGGPATRAKLSHPRGVTVGPDGSVYVTDYLNHRVRAIDGEGIIRTVAGGRHPGHEGDLGPATKALLNKPSGVAFGPDGSLFITEHENHAVRRIDPDGRISTIAGGNGRGWAEGGDDAREAVFNWPSGVAVDGQGSVYVADRNNDVLRRLEPKYEERIGPPRSRWGRVTAPVGRRSRRRSSSPQYLFVVGCPRSGTTALTKLLHSHSHVVIGLERYRWLLRGLEREGSFARLGPDLFRAKRFLALRPTETTVMPDSDQAREHYALARERLQRGQVRIIGDKVPPTVAITQALAGAFPGARFVFLYRDPYRVAASFAARAARGDGPWPADAGVSVAIDYWNEAFTAADALTARVGAHGLFIVRHESLFSGDEDCMRAMFRFLGADVTEEVLDWFRRTVRDWPAREQAARHLDPADEKLVRDGHDRASLERFDRLFAAQFASSMPAA